MRRNVLIIASLFGVLWLSDSGRFLWRSTAGELDIAATAPATKVATLDLAHLFANHVEFQKMSDGLRKDVEKAEVELKRRKAELQVAVDRLEKLEKGSAEYIEREAETTRVRAELDAGVNQQRNDFFNREAQTYLEVYQEIMAEVSKLARARGINLVMRFNGDDFDPDDPKGIQKELNKAILFQEGIDITDDVLRIVNAKPAT